MQIKPTDNMEESVILFINTCVPLYSRRMLVGKSVKSLIHPAYLNDRAFALGECNFHANPPGFKIIIIILIKKYIFEK